MNKEEYNERQRKYMSRKHKAGELFTHVCEDCGRKCYGNKCRECFENQPSKGAVTRWHANRRKRMNDVGKKNNG